MSTASSALAPELCARFREFVERDGYALEGPLLRDGFPALLPALAETRAAVKAAGLWAPQLPSEWGGMGLGVRAFAEVSEILGRTPLGHYLFNCQSSDIGNMEVLLAHGTDAQKQRFLRPVADGLYHSSFAMTEPGHAGSNAAWIDTTAIRDGDEYVINGHKWMTSAFDGSGFVLVVATTNPEAASPYERISQILVPSDSPGLVHVRNVPIMGVSRGHWMSQAEIRFEDCRVPVTNLLGHEGAGFKVGQDRLGPGRIYHCMRWIGICERAFELMCERAATRELAPGVVLATRQAVQHWLAECRAEVTAARLLVMDALDKVEANGTGGARMEISLIKFFVADVMLRVLDRAIQVHGAMGLTADSVLSFWYQDERAARIYDGADEVHKTVVARHLMRPYGVKLPVF